MRRHELIMVIDCGRIGLGAGHTTKLASTNRRTFISVLAIHRSIHNANVRSYLEKNIMTELIKLNLELTGKDLCVK